MSDTPALPEIPVEKARSPLAEAWEMFRRNHAAVAALVVLVLIVLGAIFGPPLYGTDPFDMVWAPFSPPGADGFLLGTERRRLEALMAESGLHLDPDAPAAEHDMLFGLGVDPAIVRELEEIIPDGQEDAMADALKGAPAQA